MKSLFIVFALFAAVAFAAWPYWNNSWIVLVADGSGWNSYSYATQSSMYKLYHTIKKQTGIPDNRIITFFTDDIAYNQENPFPGQVFNEPYVEGGSNVNVYDGMLKDYTGEAFTKENLINVLTGVPTSAGSGKILKSTSYDNVFILMTGHVSSGSPYKFYYKDLSNDDIYYAITNMTAKSMYNKLMFIIDACYSAGMFSRKSYRNPYWDNVYLVSSEMDSCWSSETTTDYDPYLHVQVKRDWTNYFTNLLETKGLDITIEDLYNTMDARYVTYKPCQYGDSYVKNMTLGEFIHGTKSDYRTNAIFPHMPICDSSHCTTSCDSFAICKKRGYDNDRCKKLVCQNSDRCLS